MMVSARILGNPEDLAHLERPRFKVCFMLLADRARFWSKGVKVGEGGGGGARVLAFKSAAFQGTTRGTMKASHFTHNNPLEY